MRRHPRTDEERLNDILEAASRIQAFEVTDFDTFCRSETVISNTCYHLMVIGEASRHLPFEFKEMHSDIRWQDFITMRNLIAHRYFDLDLERVWATVQNDLPILKRQVETILESLRRTPSDDSGNGVS